MPSPSSATEVDADVGGLALPGRAGPPSAGLLAATVTVPSPCRTAFSMRLDEDLVEPVGVGPHLGQVVGDLDDEPVASAGRRPPSRSTWRLEHGRRRRSAWGGSARRPASIRETSSSSVMSRVTRSASASIVSIISRFCSSVNRSQRRSSVDEKPLTDVSGERSSWATVEISAACSASARRRYERVAHRHVRPG